MTGATAAALTVADVDQIAEGIEHFIINGDAEVDAIWQPYVDQLRAQRFAIAAAPDMLELLRICSGFFSKGEPCAVCSQWPHRDDCALEITIAEAEGRS